MKQLTELGKDFYQAFANHAAESAKLGRIYEAAVELGLTEREDGEENPCGLASYMYIYHYSNPPQILLEFWTSGVTITMELVEPSAYLTRAVRVLLPKVGQFNKRFDESTGKVQFVALYKGVEIVLSSKPPSTCTVEAVEEEIAVPETVVPAHTQKKVRWVLSGDCEPFMAQGKSDVVTAVPEPEPELTIP